MDEQEFVMRVEQMTDRLYRVCRTILRSDADCQDAAQNAIFRAWQAIGALRKKEAFEPWLLRIAINECRKIARRNVPHVPLEDHWMAGSQADSFFEIVYPLEEKYRVPLELFYVERYRTCDIARILRLPEGTVKRRLHTARKWIREGLDAH